MSYSHFFKRSLPGALATAVGSVALMLVGCSDQPAQSESPTLPTDAPAIQSADRQQGAPTSDATAVMAFPTGNRATSDLLVEEFVPREARVGMPYQYQIRVTNLRNTKLNGVVLDQRIPENLKLDEGSSTAIASENSQNKDRWARINIGDLDPSQSKTVQMTGTPTQQGKIDTCLTARWNPSLLCAVVNVVSPAIGIVAEGPSQADICQDLTYKFTVTNTGTGTAHNVVVRESLPQGLQTPEGQQTVSAKVGDIASGQSKAVTVQLRALQPGSFTTQATATSDDAAKVDSQQVATAIQAPRLAVTVAGPKQEYLGDELTYQVTVANKGDAPAAGAKVRLGATPGSVEFISAQNADGAKISQEFPGTGQELGTIAPGQSRTLAVIFKAKREGRLSLDATAEARCAQPVTTPVNTDIMDLTAAALVVTHDPDPVRVGTDVVYHISVMNKGTAVDRNYNVSVTLPESLEFVKANGSSTSTSEGQTVTFANIPELAPKQQVTWELEAKALKADEAQLHVRMTSESTKKPAVKVEPTKLFGFSPEIQQRTNEAKPVAPITPQTPPQNNPTNK